MVELGELEIAKEIALDFIKKASFQIACSDEGQMIEEVEACLLPVIEALAVVQPQLHRDWAMAMSYADGTGCICCQALEDLSKVHQQ